MGVITDRKPVTAKAMAELIDAMAYAVDLLAMSFSLEKTQVAIKKLLACDDRIWDELSEETVEILEKALGMKRPGSEENGGT